ncbi:MAG TPA: cell envelope integrity protein CreD [Caldimonas sp.]|nr:cell envelope integrity protein CreD [Caldimonas sp.]
MAARRFPILAKLAAIGAVLIGLVLALHAVSDVVAERQGRLREAEASVAASLAGSQTLVGPLVARECVETWDVVQGEGKDRKTLAERRSRTLVGVPATLEVTADAAIEPRHRGIYVVHAYALKSRLVATWNDGLALQAEREHAGSRLECDPPSLFVALGDARGVRQASVVIDGAPAPVLAGTTHGSQPRGFHVALAPAWAGARAPLRAEIALDLAGTGELAFAPVAERTLVTLASDWPHPSFGGRFLPADREVGEQGFRARWQLNALATTAPQAVRAGARPCALGDADPEGPLATADANTDRRGCIETFGVAFFDPISPYALADRATKYGLLFIALTFAGVGGVEVVRRLRVHPVQYGLVGAALAIFFLLLVSLSEHVPFGAAYATAAAACTLLLTFYGAFVLRARRAGALFGAGVGLLYGVLYALLQLEQTALLLGSLVLFATLAALMVATRHIDWYALAERARAAT